MTSNHNVYDFAIVGGGAAGVFSAVQCGLALEEQDFKSKFGRNPRIIVLEGSRRLLTKVKISGGGRCNVTHSEFDTKKLVTNYPRGFRELQGPFSRFQPLDTIKFFESRGVELKTEKDGRMFPVTDDSQTIIDTLMAEIDRLGIEIQKGFMLSSVNSKPKSQQVYIKPLKGDEVIAKQCLFATGSNPSIWKMLASMGVKIVDPVPSLFTFNVNDDLLEDLSGTSFQSVNLQLEVGKKKMKLGGPLLITHWGLSGPAVLKLSAFAARFMFEHNYQATLKCNFLPEQNEQIIFESITKTSKENLNIKPTKFSPFEQITKRMWTRFCEVCEISNYETWQQVPSKKIRKLSTALTGYSFKVSGKGVFKEEFVTAGGVNLKEIDLKSMRLKNFERLYVAGELTNVDGITGGFNFQNAWTSGFLCGRSVAERILEG